MVDETKVEGAAAAAAPAAKTTEETAPTLKKDIVPPEYRKRYAELGGTCGDFIAAELTSMMESGGTDSLSTVKTENGIPVARWNGLNNGQQRMNLSNTLRASFLRGETIKIAGKEYNLAALRDEFGKLDPTDRKSVDKFLEFVNMQPTDRNAAAIKRVFHDLPEKARKQAEREAEREKTKAEKAAKKEADDKVKAEKKAADDKAKAEKTKADAKPAKADGKAKGAAKTPEPATA